MRETHVGTSGVVSGDDCRPQPPGGGGHGMPPLGQNRLHRDDNLFTTAAGPTLARTQLLCKPMADGVARLTSCL
jgi:hypothetical protein